MRISDIFSMAIRNMFKRKLRTFLTITGVIIGATAIVVMMSLGIAVNMNFDEQIEAMGHRALRFDIYQNWQPQPGEIATLNDDIVNRINAIPGVVVATPIVHTQLTILSGRYLGNISITGMKPEALEAFGFAVQQGRGLDNSDEWQIVFGSNVSQQFRDPRNQNMNNMLMMGRMPGAPETNVDLLSLPLRASYRWDFGQPAPPGGTPTGQGGAIRPYIVDGRGILAVGDDWETQSSSFMPLAQVQRIIEDRERWEESQGWGGGGGSFMMDQDGNVFSQPEGYTQIRGLVDHPNNIQSVIAALLDMGLAESHIWNEASLVNSQRETSAMLRMLLTVIGVVVLIVAAIGIMNTMVMSIYERTKEIGVMKVIGASVRDIRRLFLLEASLIGAVGGILGLGLSWLVSYGLNNITNVTFFQTQQMWWMPVQEGSGLVSFIPMWLYILAFGFSAIIGLTSGFLPALRATRISALAAIRTE